MTKDPIMTSEQERFMALDGLVQWTSAAINQAGRLTNAKILDEEGTPEERRLTIAASRTEADFFVAAAWKLLQFRKWVKELGLCANIDFGEIDKFDTADTRDLRNMREHVVDYFQGRGNNQDRWLIETPEYRADASSRAGNMIGARLDYAAFSQAAARLLPHVLKEPLPKVAPRVPLPPNG
jgi:hypothetical protein